MTGPADLITGAEATVFRDAWLGRAVVVKARVPKGYRHPELDARLRNERTRDEASLLLAARKAGVPVPLLYDVDRVDARLILEAIDGPAMRHVLGADEVVVAVARFRCLGGIVARLHAAGLSHGDLTTSNILVPHVDDSDSIVLIDFGLGQFTPDAEQHAVDLHLMEEALEATDDRAGVLMDALMDGYRAFGWKGSDAVFRRLEAVRERGRYRGAT